MKPLLILLLFVMMVAVPATLLGWTAVSQIRRSGGKLHGLWLAVFDGLLFPLLALNAFVGWLVWLVLFAVASLIGQAGRGSPGTPEVFLLSLPIIIPLNLFIIRRVWGAVNAPPTGGVTTGSERPIDRSQTLAWTSVAVVTMILLLALIALPNFISRDARNAAPEQLADSPFELRKLPTDQVIQAALAKPISPWAWQELEKRQLDSNAVAQIVDGLEAWVKQECPDGCENPLSWTDNWLEKLNNRHLLSEAQKVRLMVAIHGNLRIEPLTRLREGDTSLNVAGECRYIWRQDFLGLVLMTAPLSATVDGQPVKQAYGSGHSWNIQHFGNTLTLPKLAPGKHKLRLEALSALVAKDDLAGLPSQSPPEDWPPAKKLWTRFAELEFTIYPRDADIVVLTEDPALDPVNNGSLGIKSAIVRSKGVRSQAVLNFNFGNTTPVPISFDVSLRVVDQLIPCGRIQAFSTAQSSSRSGEELTVELDRLAPEIRTVDIVLTPNPKAVEQYASVHRIWGREVVFQQVRLIRQDLGEVASTAPVVQTTDQVQGEHTAAAAAPRYEMRPGARASRGALLLLAMLAVALILGVAIAIGIVALVRWQKRGGTGNSIAIGCAALLGGGVLILVLVVGGLFWMKATKMESMRRHAEAQRAEFGSAKLARLNANDKEENARAAAAQAAAAAATSSDAIHTRIEQLIRSGQVHTGYDFELFEKVPGMAGEYRIRPEAQRSPLISGSTDLLTPRGAVHHLPAQNRFYIQWDPLGTSTLHYYGPFEGNPAEVLSLTNRAARPDK